LSSFNKILFVRLKEQLIKSVYASTKDVKETNDQYEQHIKLLEKVIFIFENRSDEPKSIFIGSRKG